MNLNSIKQIALTSLLCFQITLAWFGQVIVVQEDNQNDYWVLLGYNGKVFHTFAQQALQGEKGYDVAQKAWDATKNNPLLKGSKKTAVVNAHKVVGTPWGAVTYCDKDENKNVSDIFHVIKISPAEAMNLHGYTLYESSDNFTKDLSQGAGWIKINDIINGTLSKVIAPDLQKKNPPISQRLLDFFQGKNKPSGDAFKNAKNFADILKTFSSGDNSQPSNVKLTQQGFNQGSKWPKPQTPGTIHFYNSGKPYYEFTNTRTAAIKDEDGYTWPTTEAYFQAGKFNNPETGKTFVRKYDTTPGQLQAAMRTYKDKDDLKAADVWVRESFQRMLKALWAKFSQHEDLQKILLRTQEQILIEDTAQASKLPKDKFYGADDDYNGANHLGQMLMQIRDTMLTMQQNSQIIPTVLPSGFTYNESLAPKDYLTRQSLLQKNQPSIPKPKTESLNQLALGLHNLSSK